VIRTMPGMPAGVIGLEAVGRVSDQDYEQVLVPAVSSALERGDVRLLYVLGSEFDSYSAGAVWADTKLFAGHPRGWKKVAVVSDADWLENSVKAFGWLMPGKVRVFETDDVDDALEWLTGVDDDDD
jgi:hypothetical protein